jgi:hypothetical protein
LSSIRCAAFLLRRLPLNGLQNTGAYVGRRKPESQVLVAPDWHHVLIDTVGQDAIERGVGTHGWLAGWSCGLRPSGWPAALGLVRRTQSILTGTLPARQSSVFRLRCRQKILGSSQWRLGKHDHVRAAERTTRRFETQRYQALSTRDSGDECSGQPLASTLLGDLARVGFCDVVSTGECWLVKILLPSTKKGGSNAQKGGRWWSGLNPGGGTAPASKLVGPGVAQPMDRGSRQRLHSSASLVLVDLQTTCFAGGYL